MPSLVAQLPLPLRHRLLPSTPSPITAAAAAAAPPPYTRLPPLPTSAAAHHRTRLPRCSQPSSPFPLAAPQPQTPSYTISCVHSSGPLALRVPLLQLHIPLLNPPLPREHLPRL